MVIFTHAYGDRQGVRWLSGGLKVYYAPRLPINSQASQKSGICHSGLEDSSLKPLNRAGAGVGRGGGEGVPSIVYAPASVVLVVHDQVLGCKIREHAPALT